MKTVRIAAAQTREYREDIETALGCIAEVTAQAESEGVRLLCFPEGFLQGYLIDETSARRVALDLSSGEFEAILHRFPQTEATIVVGIIETEGGRLFNTALVIRGGSVVGRYRKTYLLDAEKAFDAGTETPIFEVDGLRFGINICYDTNFPEAARRVSELGASLLVCAANNMMSRQKAETFRELHNAVRGERCRETGLWLVSSDVTGERDGRIALGPTAVLNPEGEVAGQLPLEKTGLLIFDIPLSVQNGTHQAC
ncbi:carbon-nitrogen hydrolase family protein [Neorhizobium galegae]|uniref:carbon-nitrogen hydrolase family protein n=1 Tax=Neorhizobium galegae TaxID=399 RepID=UPI0006216B48|nr:carbon-nitrogen hydrolase family protein [Neorhizobium galegae]KAB1127273.1 carbon-nitrogen hydrolase family protein [Neorhizobium galegae]MCQ1808369.1 carbon-nitrogen hydrolase family protein [Neorhizobium galegae]CDZ61157.1 Putative NAD(P)-binding amidase-type enzyme [Neorhizobium galegae bv. orientalis]